MDVGGVRVEVASRFEEGRSLNDNSVVLRLVHGEVALLFAGDVEALAEAESLPELAPLVAALGTLTFTR